MDYKEKIISILTNKELTLEQQQQLETIFPELAESDDEKIRKWLIAQLKIKIGDNVTLNNMIYKAIDWLEKQGEQKPDWSEEDEEKFNITLWYVRHPRKGVLKDTMLVEWLKSLRDRLQH